MGGSYLYMHILIVYIYTHGWQSWIIEVEGSIIFCVVNVIPFYFHQISVYSLQYDYAGESYLGGN